MRVLSRGYTSMTYKMYYVKLHGGKVWETINNCEFPVTPGQVPDRAAAPEMT